MALTMADDVLSRNEMVAEVNKRSRWVEVDSNREVRLVHYFRDEENKRMDVLFAEDGALTAQHADWLDFQFRFVPA